MAGTPEKMFEYLLETLIDNKSEDSMGVFTLFPDIIAYTRHIVTVFK